MDYFTAKLDRSTSTSTHKEDSEPAVRRKPRDKERWISKVMIMFGDLSLWQRMMLCRLPLASFDLLCGRRSALLPIFDLPPVCWYQ